MESGGDPNHEWRESLAGWAKSEGVDLIPSDDGHLIGWRLPGKVAVRPKRPERFDCPVCEGTGHDVNPENQISIEPCDLCQGRGYVILIRCANCGRPAYMYEEGGPRCCGRLACLKSMLPQARTRFHILEVVCNDHRRLKWRNGKIVEMASGEEEPDDFKPGCC